MTSVPGVLWATAAAILLLPVTISAQDTRDRIEVSFGGHWMGPVDLDSPDGRLTTPGGGDFVLFETDSELAQVTGLGSGVAVRIARWLRVGAEVSLGKSRFTTRVTDDVEGAVNTTVAERVTEFTIGGVIVVPLSPGGSRAGPFVSAGAGHLRHLHEGRPLVENGRIYHVGGGVDYLLQSTGDWAIGIRGEARAVFRSAGVFHDESLQVSPAAAGSLFFRF